MMGSTRVLMAAVLLCLAIFVPTPVRADAVSCDSCRTLVERFHHMWDGLVKKKASRAAKVASSDQGTPAFEYDGEFETAVLGICESAYFKTNTKSVRAGCSRIMKDRVNKKAIVSEFLSKHVINFPAMVERFCVRVANACSPSGADVPVEASLMGAAGMAQEGEKPSSACMSCRDIMVDTLFQLRRIPIPATREERKEVAFAAIDMVCSASKSRRKYKDHKNSIDQCEDVRDALLDDHERLLLNTFVDRKVPKDLQDTMSFYPTVAGAADALCGSSGLGECGSKARRANDEL
eukprot:g5571.t1